MGEAEPRTEDGVGFLVRGRFVLIIYGGAARLHRTRWLFESVEDVTAGRDGLVALMLIPAGAEPPDAVTRRENKKRLERLRGRLDLLVTVPMGDAFWISIVRTVMRGMAMVHRQTGWNLVESTFAAGLDRVCGLPDVPPRTQVVQDALVLCEALGRDPESILDGARP
ncbi:MAG TPA: hypothetical protein RMH99_09865 [Sandaracinaceae bacterium LLY-WYZ-13_1]|nr:hypothetical protein [Sandaracinaceae bacterium LLY-WYZ-13_1]